MASEDRPNPGARFLMLAASLVVVVAGIKAASTLILPFLVSIFLSLISLPLLNWLLGRRIPRALAVLITLMAAIGVLTGMAAIIAGSISSFTAEAPKYQARLLDMTSALLDDLNERGLNVSQSLTLDLVNPGRLIDVFTVTLRAVRSVLSNFVLGLLTISFILFEASGFQAKLHVAFGGRQSSERFDKIRREVQQYLGIKSLISLITGALVAIAMALIGVDFPLLWGVVAFMLNFIPNLGSIIAAIPPVLLAMVQLGWGHALAVALVFVGVNVTLGSLIEPYFMGRRLGLSTLVVFISLIFWGWVWGPVGMLLAVPLTMIVKIMLENTEDLRWIAVLLGASPSAESSAVSEQETRRPHLREAGGD